MMGCGVGDSLACTWGDSAGFKDSNGTIYMIQLPKDPVSGRTYYYVSTGTSYKIYAKMENTLDTGEGVLSTGYSGTNCSTSGSVLCTYGVSSSNTKP